MVTHGDIAGVEYKKYDTVYYWNSFPNTPTNPNQPLASDLYGGVSYQSLVQDDSDLNFIDNWDASSGIFPVVAAQGDFWNITTEGIIEGIFFGVGDKMVYNGVAFTNGLNSGQNDRRGNSPQTVQCI